MDLRELMLLLGGGMTTARALRAQQTAMPMIGFLSSVSAESTAFRVTASRQGLSETGYVEGQNLAIEVLSATFIAIGLSHPVPDHLGVERLLVRRAIRPLPSEGPQPTD